VNRRSVLVGVAVLTMLLANPGVPAQKPPPQTIRVICLPGIPLPLLIAKARGIFSRYQIEVVAEKATSASALRDALENHTADIAHSSVENAVAADNAGGMDSVIVMGGEESTSELIVQPEIRTVSDLRGHLIILDGADTAYTLLLKKILSRNGLRSGLDYEMKVVGLAPQRLQAMRDHPENAATIQKPPTSILSERAGLKSLGSTDALSGMGKFQGIGGFVTLPWARDHGDLLERYIAAFVEAQRWMMGPANEKQVIALMASEGHMPLDIAEQTYQVAMKEAWTPDARFDVAGFNNVLALEQQEQGATGTQPAPEKYYDLSWYSHAIDILSRSK
jgi:ABC-type nitrate/sulfonate/bicarbonate transport system substrate-binding protein